MKCFDRKHFLKLAYFKLYIPFENSFKFYLLFVITFYNIIYIYIYIIYIIYKIYIQIERYLQNAILKQKRKKTKRHKK